MFLLRLSPVFPFVFLNYALGLTRVRLLDYALACFGMLPGTILYVYYGKVVGDVAALAAGAAAERGTAHYVVLGLGLLATLVVTTVVTRIAQRALKSSAALEQPAEERRCEPMTAARDDGRPRHREVEPFDQHNQRLVENVHPPDWRNPTPKDRYHLVVIGAGAAGLVSAVGSAGLGAKVALVERHLLGGDCLNVGCVPSKAVIRAARAWHDAREGGAFGAPRGGPRGRRLRRRDGAHAPRARADQSDRQRGAVDQRRRRRVPRARPLHRSRLGRGGRRGAAIPPRRDRHRRARRGPADPRPRAGRLPHQRDDLRADRAAAAPGGDRRRTDRLRAGAGVRPVRRAGDAVRRGAAGPDPRGRRRRQDRRRRAGARRRRARARREDDRGARERRRRRRADDRAGSAAASGARRSATRSWSRWAARPTSRISDWRRPASPTTRPASWSTTGYAPPTPGSSPPATSRRCPSSRTSPTRTPRW